MQLDWCPAIVQAAIHLMQASPLVRQPAGGWCRTGCKRHQQHVGLVTRIIKHPQVLLVLNRFFSFLFFHRLIHQDQHL